MKEIISELEKEKEGLVSRIKDIDNAIESFRKVCKHVDADGKNMFVYEGQNSHHDFYKCSICGEDNKV